MELDIFDPDYVRKQQTASLQRMAAEQNALRVQLYRQASADWIAANLRNRDIGLPLTAVPLPPRKIVVGDDGEWREVAFDDLVPPALPSAVAPQTGGSLRPSGPVPPDRLDQVLAALQLLNAKLDRWLAASGT